MSDDIPLEKLEHPPIVEVICGVWFADAVDLDPVVLGAYWLKRRESFPKHELHPPIETGGRIVVGMRTPRTWLVSKDESLVLQVQPDRFYLNWRARGPKYPRFSDPGALRDQSIDEFQKLRDFCGEELGHRPELARVEVGKIDHFEWRGKDDLCALMPALRGWLELSTDALPSVVFRLEEGNDDASLLVIVGIVMIDDGHTSTPVIRMETTATQRVTALNELRQAFDRANARVNTMFERLIPRAERVRRFGETQ